MAERPAVHIVAGFLGSGKTTAILQSARTLVRQGRRVGIVTNDQGRFLVDSSLFSDSQLPTVEVTGGCFCCNYPDLERVLRRLSRDAHPEIIYAESVGSCADLVATVFKPLEELAGSEFEPASFSVFADARLLRLHLAGEELPFSDAVNYLFEKQIEEGGLLVINKIDLLPQGEVDPLLRSTRERYPDKTILGQSSLSEDGVLDWLETIRSGRGQPAGAPLVIDYDRYAAGEADLAWLDGELEMDAGNRSLEDLVRELLGGIRSALESARVPIGHVKIFIQMEGHPGFKCSLVGAASGWQPEPAGLGETHARLLLNMRVEMDKQELSMLMRTVLDRPGVRVTRMESFHPQYPTPTRRLG